MDEGKNLKLRAYNVSGTADLRRHQLRPVPAPGRDREERLRRPKRGRLLQMGLADRRCSVLAYAVCVWRCAQVGDGVTFWHEIIPSVSHFGDAFF
ncbi:hypothetical protein EVAR_54705_1 [Eumeta japonica]|uniref:Uncharacterized protein n=1 Tax=Eumeta variegata TaxID=151549 RepID=A0A4C1YQR3_EUMVA|nr:hypothetical protein EVAR_54705_1 [Eumeta japonica]